MVGICWLSRPRHQGTKAARHAIGNGGFGITYDNLHTMYDNLQKAAPRLNFISRILILYIK